MRVMKCDDIVLMLDHFKKEHEQNNRVLIDFGESKRCTNWEDVSIPVKDIIDFMEYNTNNKL